jgi:glyoxylase-like metal-dependent hydrolase (beta-lactamase superfamily II)
MITRVHHLNCISTCPVGGGLMDGESGASLRGKLTCHCLLLETARGLVLVDTGLGLRDVREPRKRLSKLFLALVSPDFREEMTAVRQIEAMGFDARDVRDIVLTHLDFDHAGGLDDFPGATVHLLGTERDAATAQETVLDRMRYRPQQWGTRASWQVHAASSAESWFGFECVRDVAGLDDVLLVPLIGHTLGHCGVAVRALDERTPVVLDDGARVTHLDDGARHDGGHDWLFYAGDAYFFRDEMSLENPRCTPGLRFYQWMLEKDRDARLANQRRLRELKRDHDVRVFCAHDVKEFSALAQRSPDVPAPRVTDVDHAVRIDPPQRGIEIEPDLSILDQHLP